MKRSYLLGDGVSHTIAPHIHNTTAASLGLDWRYEGLDAKPDELPAAFARIRAEDSTGANITMPYKLDAAREAEERTEPVERSGATNLLVNRGGRLTAHNTDVIATVLCLQRRAQPIGAGSAVLLGAGGVAAAALEAFRTVPPRAVFLLARSPERAAALAERAGGWLETPIEVLPIDRAERALADASLLVNATSLGMRSEDAWPFDPALLSPGLLFYDYVYSRQDLSPLQAEAVERGVELCEGATHNLEQAGPSFELLSGATAPPAVVRGALVEVLGREPVGWDDYARA